MTNTSTIHRRQRRRSRALLASALAATVIATMLQPVAAIAAPAQVATPAASTAPVVAPDTAVAPAPGTIANEDQEGLLPTVDGAVIHYKTAGIKELSYDFDVSFSDLPSNERCGWDPSAWIQVTDEAGNSSWVEYGNIDTSDTDIAGEVIIPAKIRDADMYYPGGDLTLTYYGKVANNPDDKDPHGNLMCIKDSNPKPTDDYVAYKTNTLRVEWAKPEIIDVFWDHKNLVNGAIPLVVQVDSSWTNFDKNYASGGLATFEISNYGQANQLVKFNAKVCEILESNEESILCHYKGDIPEAGDAIGFAAISANATPSTITKWPPTGAIDYEVMLSPKQLPKDSTNSQAGTNESMQCTVMCTGDPIDTYTGNFFESLTDLSVAGPIGLSVDRQYAVGLLGTSGAFGDGTAFGYDMHLDVSDTARITVVEPSGNFSKFARDGQVNHPINAGLQADLTTTSSGWEYSRWNEVTTYVFNADGRLTSIRDNNGNAVAVNHDDEGLVASVSEGNRSITFTWNGDLLSSATDHTGRTVSYSYTDGKLTSVSDPAGGVNSYAYDSANRITQMTNGEGGVTTNTYDAEGRTATQELPSGQLLELSYGSSGANKITTETSGDVVKKYTYDANGRVIKFTDSSDVLAQFTRTYDSSNNITKETLYDPAPKSYTYGYINGNLTSVAEKNAGSTQSYEYNAERRITASVDAAGIRTENTYDDAGNLTSTKVISVGDEEPRITSYVVNEAGETTSITNPLGGVSTLVYDEAHQLISLTNPVGGKTTYSYNELGQVLTEISAGGNADGADPADFTTSYSYDSTGNITTVTNASGTTTYTYDALNRPTQITDAEGNTQSVQYDGGGNPVTVTYADGSTDAFTYDADTGTRTSWTDPQGRTTTYEQDGGIFTTTAPDGAVTKLTTSAGLSSTTVKHQDPEYTIPAYISEVSAKSTQIYLNGSGGKSHKSTYNAAGQLITENNLGELVNYAYDGFGQLVSQTGDDRNVSYTYDAAGNIASITYPDGTSITRETDLAGRVTKLTGWDGTVYEISYNAASQISAVSSSTGLSYSAGFDGADLTSKTWTDELGQTLAAFGYSYNSSGTLSSDSVNDFTREFDWNANGALTSVNNDPVTWDARLLTSTGSTELTYNAASGRLTQSTTGDASTSYSYDATGHRIASTTGDATTSYTWNRLGQLTKLDDTSYSYGSNGIRTKVDSAAQVYYQGLKLLADGDMKYLWSPDGSLLAQAPLESTNVADTQLAVTDAMGSVYQVRDSELESLGEYSYTVFGERTLTAGTDASAIGFTSEQHDASGLIYLRYRYMDPTVGQFISVDPMLNSTLDPYGYASGNPLQLTDPLGLWTWTDTDNLVGGIGSVAGVIGLGATILAFTLIGAPIVGAIAAATLVTSVIGVGTGLYSTAQTCPGGLSASCLSSGLGAVVSGISLLKPFAVAWSLATSSANVYRSASQIAHVGINGLGVMNDAAGREINKNTANHNPNC